MIRPVTLITMVTMLGSGAWMFVVKHQAEQLDQRIGGVTAQIRSSEQRIRVLRAEWALETDPTRLARLAAMFMPRLKPMMPDQMVTWDRLADRLPPPGATIPQLPLPPPLPDELPDRPEMVASAGPVASGGDLPAPPAPAPAPAPAAAAASEAAPAAAPAGQLRLAASRSTPPAAHRVAPVQHSVQHSVHHPVQHTVSARVAARRPQDLGASVLAPRPVDRPMGARVMTITARAPDVPPPAAAPMRKPARNPSRNLARNPSGSVFGDFGANLSPPRPVGGSAP